jgi:hypothetical protein
MYVIVTYDRTRVEVHALSCREADRARVRGRQYEVVYGDSPEAAMREHTQDDEVFDRSRYIVMLCARGQHEEERSASSSAD